MKQPQLTFTQRKRAERGYAEDDRADFHRSERHIYTAQPGFEAITIFCRTGNFRFSHCRRPGICFRLSRTRLIRRPNPDMAPARCQGMGDPFRSLLRAPVRKGITKSISGKNDRKNADDNSQPGPDHL